MSKATVFKRLVLVGLKSRNFFRLYVLGLLLLYCMIFYYFGELVDFFGWEVLRWEFFYSVHDVHRLFFLAPIVYAGYVFGVRATIIITIISAVSFMPRAVFISPYPDPLLRVIIFIVIAGAMGYLTARMRVEYKKRLRLEALLINERDKLSGILVGMEDGVLIVGPDYRIRFMNPSMVRDFGEGIGSFCYECLHGLNKPCPEICKLPNVINGDIARWEYKFPDERTYEVQASPYRDLDGVICQLTTFRNITPRKKAQTKRSGSTN